jgi:hypothetical protein
MRLNAVAQLQKFGWLGMCLDAILRQIRRDCERTDLVIGVADLKHVHEDSVLIAICVFLNSRIKLLRVEVLLKVSLLCKQEAGGGATRVPAVLRQWLKVDWLP